MKSLKSSSLLTSLILFYSTAANADFYVGARAGTKVMSATPGFVVQETSTTNQNGQPVTETTMAQLNGAFEGQAILSGMNVGKRFYLPQNWFIDSQVYFDFAPVSMTLNTNVGNGNLPMETKSNYTYGLRFNFGKKLNHGHNLYGIFGVAATQMKLAGVLKPNSQNRLHLNVGAGYEVPITDSMSLRFEGEVGIFIKKSLDVPLSAVDNEVQIGGNLKVKSSNAITIGMAYKL